MPESDALPHSPAMYPGKRSSPTPTRTASTRDLKDRVNSCLNRLADRDTHALAVTELEYIAGNLTHETFSPFISYISDVDSSDKTPVRTQSVRLLGYLSQSHGEKLAGFLPKMLAAIVRRLRDPNSTVRSACADAVGSMASEITKPPFAVFLKPLSDVVFLEQDYNSQNGSAICLSTAMEASRDPGLDDLQRIVPKFVKLLKSESFKAKPALISLIGSVIGVGGASNANLLGLLVPTVVEFLYSNDWMARKAATEALTRVALTEKQLASEFKSSCLSAFETRKFDKVKVVRDSMNRMLEVWRDVPDVSNDVTPPSRSESSSRENASDGQFSADSRSSDMVWSDSPYAKKNRSTISRSPTPDSSSATTTQKKSPISNDKKLSPTSFRKKTSDWKIEIAVSHAPPLTVLCEDEKDPGKGENKNNGHPKFEAKRVLFDKNCDDKAQKFGGLRSASRVVPLNEIEGSDSSNVVSNAADDEFNENPKEGDLSLIRKKLLQIEDQQSSLLNLLQRFIGNSQNGLRSLETRVHGLEMALDEISHGLAVSTGRIENSDTSGNTCCKLPGAEFLSSKFWRRTDGRYSTSSCSSSGTPPLAALHNITDKGCVESFKSENRRFRPQEEFIVNPLAEFHSQSRGSSEVYLSRTPKNAIYDPYGSRQGCNSNRFDEVSAVATTFQLK